MRAWTHNHSKQTELYPLIYVRAFIYGAWKKKICVLIGMLESMLEEVPWIRFCYSFCCQTWSKQLHFFVPQSFLCKIRTLRPTYFRGFYAEMGRDKHTGTTAPALVISWNSWKIQTSC